MKVEQKGHTVTIKDTQGDLDSFRLKLTANSLSHTKNQKKKMALIQLATL